MASARQGVGAAWLERLVRVERLEEACSVLLAAALEDSGSERGALVLRRGDDVWDLMGLPGPGWRRLSAGELTGTGLREALDASEPSHVAFVGAADDALSPCVVLPLPAASGQGLGALLIETDPSDVGLNELYEAVRACAPVVGHRVGREALEARIGQLERESALLNRMQDALLDPVVLTDADNNVVVANHRANELFLEYADDSIGRRHAVRTNSFLFSAFLTQERMAGTARGGNDLTLVDPFDGSDLLFEVLTTGLPASEGGGESVISVLRDNTDLKRAMSELQMESRRSRGAEHRARQESTRLKAVIENAAEPILVTDARSRIGLMNREAERLFGRDDAADPTGRPSLVANVTRFTSLVSDFLLRPSARFRQRLTLTDPETGREIPFLAVSAKVLDRFEEPIAVVAVLRDLTGQLEKERLAGELRRLNEELEDRIRIATRDLSDRNRILVWQSRELQKASRLKSEFLARMSHELRTPINAVVGYTCLLREQMYGELTGEQDAALGRVEHASEHLLELISDILDLSKIEAGKMPVRLDELDLAEFVAGIVQTVRPLADEKGLDLRIDLAEELPVLRTDATKLKQVLLNLLQNAIKFTADGWVRLSATAAGHQTIRMVVEDTGIGIEASHLELIFEDFRQVDQSLTRQFGGTGLGLAISRKLMAMLGGEISVESVHGEGSRFTVELPVDADPGPMEDQLRRVMIRTTGGNGQAQEPGGSTPGPSAAAAEPGNRIGPIMAADAGMAPGFTAGAEADHPDADTGMLTDAAAVSDAEGEADGARASQLAHDLREPLQGLLGHVELLAAGLAGELSPEQGRIAGRMRESVIALTTVIERAIHELVADR